MKQKDLDPAELRVWRSQNELTQDEAARWFKVPLRTYQGWEAGRRKKQAGPIRKLLRRKPKKSDMEADAEETTE